MSKKTSGAAQQGPKDQNSQRSDARTAAPAPQQWVTMAKAAEKYPHRDPAPRDGVLGQKSQVPQVGPGSQIPLWAANQAATGDEARECQISSRKGIHISYCSGATSRGASGVNNSQVTGVIAAVANAPAPMRTVKCEITAVGQAFMAEAHDDASDLLAQIESQLSADSQDWWTAVMVATPNPGWTDNHACKTDDLSRCQIGRCE
jgi:hypothetical protein